MALERGMSATGRRELREQYRTQALAEAEVKAATAGLTVRCRDGHHHQCVGESHPQGAGCLCICHDEGGTSDA